jgi:hypothetical protein
VQSLCRQRIGGVAGVAELRGPIDGRLNPGESSYYPAGYNAKILFGPKE